MSDDEAARVAIEQQRVLLTAVADGSHAHADANAEYLRNHTRLVSLTERKTECFCPGNVIAWWNLAATLGDPAWA